MGQATPVYINQQEHFQGCFGEVLRASAIFYYRKDPQIQTTISLFNYWKIKRNLEVTLIASVRSLEGTLVRREKVDFSHGRVVNYSPFSAEESFEGSVEIEVFSLQNLFIPYAAVMAIYESTMGVSMVHSYSRAYSQHEIEEQRTITHGEESCWSVRDSGDVYSFGVFHNGGHTCPPQRVGMTLTNHCQEKFSTQFTLPALAPYETVVLRPRDYFENLPDLLEGQPGNMALSFRVQDSFTRMLVGNAAFDGSDFQVTHSNFNYSVHQTDKVSETAGEAFMDIPRVGDYQRQVVVYPDCDPGAYRLTPETGEVCTFRDGQLLTWDVTTPDPTLLQFEKTDGLMPSRVVTGLRVWGDPKKIPAECSLGIFHHQHPPKRLWWGLCAASSQYRARLIGTELKDLFASWDPKAQPVTIRMYSQHSAHCLERTLETLDALEALRHGIFFHELFPEAAEFLGGGLGWFTLYSDYPGFFLYQTLENQTGSVSLEHAF